MTHFLGKFKDNYEEVNRDNEEIRNCVIYKGINIKENRYCVLKVISRKELLRGDYDLLMAQIQREEEIGRLCNSDNTVNFYQKLETEENIIFELEYCDMNLMEYLQNNGELEYKKDFFKEIVIGVAKALKNLHEKGVMHRDIKPTNIFLKDDKTIKLGDFGSSIYIKDNNSIPIGTILYTAPEILKKLEYDEKCDLWSLGVSLFELYFGVLPYGPKTTPTTIKKIIYNTKGSDFKLRKTNIPCLDILFKRLLVINSNERMTFDEFFNFVFNDNFMKKNEKGEYINNDFYINKYKDLYKIIENQAQINYPNDINKESFNEDAADKENIIKILNYVEGGHLPDIMNFANGEINENSKFNNIIYFDENKDYISQVQQDINSMERVTLGAFIFCQELDSLNLVAKEILKKRENDKRITFNIITSGSQCEKIIKFISDNKGFEECIKNVCVYCYNKNRWSFLKEKYKIVYDVYNTIEEVINFIFKFSSNEIKVFPVTKLITFRDYQEKYRDRHFSISKFYGDLTPESYKTYLEKIKEVIKNDEKEKTLKFKPNKVIEGFLSFNLQKDLETLDKLIIREYTKNTFYVDLNKWLMNSTMNSYEPIAYFTARLMYSLNSYAKKNTMYYEKNKKEVFRGIQMTYTNLLPYERAKGNIIILSAFTSTSEWEILAETWAGRGTEKALYSANLNFSVVFIIKNYCNNKDKWISNGINIQNEAEEKEGEILYQPFSFYYVRDVQIDKKNYKADIYLETIGKTEILEEQIKNGKEVEYNRKLNIIQVSKY